RMDGDRERAEGSSVEALFQRDDLGAAGTSQARELQRGLVGLRAAVAEEGARQAGSPCQPLRQESLRRMVEEIRNVPDALRRLPQRPAQPRAAVAARADREARDAGARAAAPGR